MPNVARAGTGRGVLPIRQRAADLFLGREWYMLPERLKGLRALAEQKVADPAMLTAWADAEVPDTYVATERDGVATVTITGPMERTWGFWSWLFGSPTYELLARDLQRLRDNAAIRAIILSFDSPGGMVAGCGELAGIIRAVDAVKPVVAHAAGDCCSAAYYLASATQRIFVDTAAIVGSIGTCATYVDWSGFEERVGIEVIELVSTLSPRKNLPPTTEEGRADWMALLDSLATVFVGDVARYRGTDVDTVLAEYGQGGVFVGQEAIDAGLADALGTQDSVHAAVLAALDTPDLTLAQEQPMPAAVKKLTPKASATVPKPKADDSPADPPCDPETDPECPDTTDAPEEQATGAKPAAASAFVPNAITRDRVVAEAPDVATALRVEGATAERERILAIHGLSAKTAGNAKAQQLIRAAMAKPGATAAELALELVTGGAVAGASALAGRAGDEAAIDPPSNADHPTAEASGVEQLARSILTVGRTPAR